MITAVVQIGNSDDKLTQARWAEFQSEVQQSVLPCSARIHFAGHSHPTTIWQNACWVFEVAPGMLEWLRRRLGELSREFDQDSIALTLGETEFVETS